MKKGSFIIIIAAKFTHSFPALCKKCCTGHKKEVAPLYEVNHNEELGIIGQIADQLRGSGETLAAGCIKNIDIEVSMQNPSEVECDEMDDSSIMGTKQEVDMPQIQNCVTRYSSPY
uniref:Uncharacterized protein LOC111118719 n=1 Tax=Crassostrea virginica TaxID=6565 RepID=A0A8B8CE02_CRAVI|nr:uncharacterized protein LOC111118719 [Crassostrea virginica]